MSCLNDIVTCRARSYVQWGMYTFEAQNMEVEYMEMEVEIQYVYMYSSDTIFEYR